jgi:SAM-dependent methyltransferase
MWGENYWSAKDLERAERTASLLPSETASVLEVGCGGGIVTRALAARYRLVVGADLAAVAVRQLSSVGTLAVQCEVGTLPFADHSFDALVVAEVIEHLPTSYRKRTLAEIIRVARRHILVTVPFSEALEQSQLCYAEYGAVFHPHGHTASFDARRMSRLMSPRFVAHTLETFGPRGKQLPGPVVRLAQKFGAYGVPELNRALCPRCGNREGFVTRRNLLTRLIIRVPWRPVGSTPRWAAALYERTPGTIQEGKGSRNGNHERTS